MTLHTRVHGSQTAPVLVMLHGFLGAGDVWDPIIPHIQTDLQVVAVDLPGHGLSPAGLDPPSLQRSAELILATLDVLKIDRFALLGYSLGGRTAIWTALAAPSRCWALILEGANPGITVDDARQQRRVKDSQLATELRELGMTRFLERWYQADLFKTLHRTPQKLTALKRQRARNDTAAMADVLEALSPGRVPHRWAQLSELTMPTLLLAGSEDQRYTEVAKRAEATMPNARKVVVEGVGHNIHFEDPARFCAEVDRFLQRHLGREA